MMHTRRHVILAALTGFAVCAVAVLGAAIFGSYRGTGQGVGAIGGPFTLVGREGDPISANLLGQGYEVGCGRDWARLGNLYLQDGVWNGERILPAGYAKFVSTPAPAWVADKRPSGPHREGFAVPVYQKIGASRV